MPAARNGAEEDARILRRTRLRLMAVSGAVTLVILVALGVAAYAVVSNALESSDQSTMSQYVKDHPVLRVSSAGPDTAELGGEGIFVIYIPPVGQPIPPNHQTLPVGLPDGSSISAARASSTGTDRRFISVSDGASYQVMTVQAQAVGLSAAPGTWLVQFVQNRTSEVRMLNTLFWILLGGGAAALLAALLAGYLYAGRALVPIRVSIARRQAALQRQREFTANASHELRTPLTVIRASVDDLRRNRRSRVEDVGEALDDIDAEVRVVTALVEDMLLLARTDSGVVQIDRAPLDLADVSAEAAALATALGSERGVAVTLDPLPAPVVGDGMRLRQLVTILVDNAIRHSPAGAQVEVRVRPEPGAAVLEVRDHGPGIKPDDLPRLWERFWRADDAPAGGTGLGLAIAKWIVEQHGGAIGATNAAEGGASFWVRLPSHALPAAPAADAEWSRPTAAAQALQAGGAAQPAAHPDTVAPQAGAPRWSPADDEELA